MILACIPSLYATATTTRASILFIFYHGINIELIISWKEERIRSICDVLLKQNCRVAPSCLQECRQLVFFLKRNRFYSFNFKCECLYHILIRLWAINIVDYLLLSTISFNRGRLTWNSNALPKLIHHMLKRNVQGHHHSWNVKYTCNWHAFELQMHWFLHIMSNGKMCITSRNPLWRSMVYRRKMTAAFRWHLQ